MPDAEIAPTIVAVFVAVYSQQSPQTTTHTRTSIPSVWAYVSQTGSKTLVAGSLSDPGRTLAIALAQPNITFFLPTESAIAMAVNNSILNFANPNTTRTQLLRHLVLQEHDFNSLLRAHQYLHSNDSSTAHLPLVVGPSPLNQSNVQISSGISTANILSSIRCSNGFVHLIDHFLTPPLTTLESIEHIHDLETYASLMRSLNLTTVVSGPNKTVLAPINQAWEAATNSSTMPYGALVHSLKYQVIEGVYRLDALFHPDGAAQNVSLLTMRRDSYLHFERSPSTGELLVVGKQPSDVARIVRSDVITSEGVIHLVDRVLPADRDKSPPADGEGGKGGRTGATQAAATPATAAASTDIINAQSSDQTSASSKTRIPNTIVSLGVAALLMLHGTS
ncbi:FAS1 domain-containing protein [Dichotomocladium elegans]|nr:FAS1 domain-containing protein [Dichotomocladium elegans]